MAKVPKELLKNIPEERLAHSDEVQWMQGDISNQILQDLIHSPIKEHQDIANKSTIQVSKYIFRFPPKHKQREYNPDLEAAWDEMEHHQQQMKFQEVEKDIAYIFDSYKHFLSFDDMVHFYLILAEQCLYFKQYDDALHILEHLHTQEHAITDQQHQDMLYILGQTYFRRGSQSENLGDYQRSFMYFNQLLGPNLDTEMYQAVLFYNGCTLRKLKEYQKSLDIINEFIDFSIKEKKMNIVIFPTALFIQGDIYEHLGMYDEAIRSFKEYLNYYPESENIKNRIRLLAEKGGE